MGERALAVSNIIRSFYVVLMIPMWGFSSATNTLVSFVIGEGKSNQVLPIVYKIVKMCLAGVMLIVSLGFIFPELALKIYTDDKALIAEALPALYVVNISALMLAAAFVFFNAVSGTGKTQVSFIIETLVVLLYIVVTYLLIRAAQGSIAIVWLAETVYALLLGTFSFLYLRYGKWKGSVL